MTAAALAYIAATGASIGAAWWAARGLLVPITTGGSLGYVVATPRWWDLLLGIAVAILLVAGGHVIARALLSGERNWPRVPEGRRFPAALPVLALLPAVPWLNAVGPLAGRLPVLTYFFGDLRWACFAALVAFVVRDQLALAGSTAGDLRNATDRRSPRLRPAIVAVLIMASALLFAVIIAPDDRVDSRVIGDEPKYLRFAENIYQRNGFAITDLQDIDRLPSGYRFTPWWIPGAVLGAIGEEVSNMALDVRFVVGSGLPATFHRAEHIDGLFFRGKNGEAYQFHTPGLGILMFPAYWIDRALLNDDNLFHHQFPSYLYATSLLFVGLFVAWAGGGFRFFVNSGEPTGRAAVLVPAVFFTAPVVTFSYQYYPEIAGGLLALLVANWALYADPAPAGRRGTWAAAGFGALAGYLPWLNIRYSLMAAVLLAWALFLRRKQRRVSLGFAAGWATAVGLFAVYNYRLTGSFSPTAVWSMNPDVEPFAWAKVPGGLLALAFEARNGIVPYSPIFLLCLLGVASLARRRPRELVFWLTVTGALAIPAAGHAWSGAVAAPGRMILAVVPFAGLALAEACRRFGRSAFFWGVFAVLLAVSMHNAHSISAGPTRLEVGFGETGISGWRSTSLFPVGIDRQGLVFDSVNDLLGPVWLAISAALLAVGYAPGRRDACTLSASPAGPTPGLAHAGGATAVIAIAAVITAALPSGYRADYLLHETPARRAVVRFISDNGCAMCASSVTGAETPGSAPAGAPRASPADLTERWGSRSFRFAAPTGFRLAFGEVVEDRAAPGRRVVHLPATGDGRRLLTEMEIRDLAYQDGVVEVRARSPAAGPEAVLEVEVVDPGTDRVLGTAAASADDLFANTYAGLTLPYRSASRDGELIVRLYHGGATDLRLLSLRVSPAVPGSAP